MVNIGDSDSDSQSESKLPTEMSEIRHMMDVYDGLWHFYSKKLNKIFWDFITWIIVLFIIRGRVSGTFCPLGGGIAFSVEECVSGIKFTMESLESESMTSMSHDTFNFSLGLVFILDVSIGVICVSEMCEMSLGGLEGTSILAVLAVIVILSSVVKYTKIAGCTYLHS